MGNFLGMDSPFIMWLNKAADIVILNILFIICCIPLITIGAASTALYAVALKIVKGEESYIVKGFFSAFKDNFKQSTILWLIVVVISAVLAADFFIIGYMPAEISKVMYILLICLTLVFLMMLLYLFPCVARFYNNTFTYFKNALFMSIIHFPYTLLMLFLTFGVVYITFFNVATMGKTIILWFIAGFSLYALVTSFLFRGVFAKYEPEEAEVSEYTPEDIEMIKDSDIQE